MQDDIALRVRHPAERAQSFCSKIGALCARANMARDVRQGGEFEARKEGNGWDSHSKRLLAASLRTSVNK